MLQSRSAIYKMLQTHATEDRTIKNWPPPFSRAMTPYFEVDFDESVRHTCATTAKMIRLSKVIVLGDVAVGKTSLVRRFCYDTFSMNYKGTIGVDFELQRFDVLGVPFNLQIWDTAGQERFKTIAASYYRSSDVIMIVFDLGSLMSLLHCSQWLVEARKSNSGSHFVFLVGTKKDTISSQAYKIVEERAEAVARDMGAEYWTVSSRRDTGVRELFTRVAALAFNAAMLKEINLKYESTQIGSELIKLKPQEYEKKDNKHFKWFKCKF